ncbi:methyl-accepting chemotaxis protein [Alkalicoccobacillus murimartini]|uniref:Methyl-accepting chemotaxis protein n=1 Tax=Alkalicoccobacillus murimartini TaxID=171685 RepID=A0ABT9YH33_9BACI|nr:methyl-accepting chemotaxis protein [Alkalicoccobacillus murimartini]MDQ0207155.1 methyl-accepting chemotaxis protein [Alkalicoccobacillus murimartini]
MKKKEKKPSNKGLSLRTKLVLSYLFILILPPLVIGYFSYESAKTNTEALIKQEAKESTQILDEMINQYITSQIENLELIASEFADISFEETSDEREASAFLEKFNVSQKNVGQVLIGTDSDTFIYQPTFLNYPDNYDVRQRSWYNQAKQAGGDVIITAPYTSLGTKRVSITLARALDNGSGVVAVDLELDDLTNMLETIALGQDGYLFLLDKNQSYISHPTQEIGTVAQESFFADMYQSEQGSFDYTFESEEKFMDYRTNELTGWKLAGTYLTKEVSDAVSPILWTTLVVIGSTLFIGALLITGVVRSITKPIRQLAKAAATIGTGDLSENTSLKQNRNDEIGELASAFENMRVSFSTLLKGVLEKSTQVASASEQLLASSEQSTRATEQITSAVQEVVITTDNQGASMENSAGKAVDLSHAVEEIAKHTNVASATAEKAQSVVHLGSQSVKTSMQQMDTIKKTSVTVAERIKQLGDSSKEINQVTDVIKEIAEQTNLLALNASIEAARAGEHGKGFAVVAEEVRKLAEQSGTASEQIREMILAIQSQASLASEAMQIGGTEVENGIRVADQANASFKTIDQYIEEMVGKISYVTTEANQVSSGAKQFVQVFKEVAANSAETSSEMQSVSASTEEQLASMEEISSSAENLTKLSEELHELVQVFKW